MLTLDDFKRIDFRVGEVVAAEPVQGARRLLKLTVDLGHERRTLVGSLAQSYTPEELHGLQIVVMMNLEPGMIRGVVSEGMMLGVGCERPGEVALLTVHRRVPNGTAVQ